ncbi:MAG TPA: hypothetical protein GXZ21_10405 [Clostridiales bacterium]|nr:hypothetical protein [Clostridiales bacterium]
MKLDHLIINISDEYQLDNRTIDEIRENGFPYEPKWGKGTKGFRASNLWIGNEYFEMIRLLKQDGGGWREEWVNHYNQGHRGLICLMLDVEDIDLEYQRILNKGIDITEPKYLQFKWFFNLLTRTMPWRNSYINFFKGIPMQIGFQQMKDKKSLDFMREYMVPNSRDNGIEGINKVIIKGEFLEEDYELIEQIFEEGEKDNDSIIVNLSNNQQLIFQKSSFYSVEVFTYGNNENYHNGKIKIENVHVLNCK